MAQWEGVHHTARLHFYGTNISASLALPWQRMMAASSSRVPAAARRSKQDCGADGVSAVRRRLVSPPHSGQPPTACSKAAMLGHHHTLAVRVAGRDRSRACELAAPGRTAAGDGATILFLLVSLNARLGTEKRPRAVEDDACSGRTGA
jgi:hypothetical protein